MPSSRGRLHATSVALLVAGLAATAGLSYASWRIHDDNEDRLLHERIAEAAAVLGAALPGVESPLASAVQVVEVTDGEDPSIFERAIGSFVGEGRRFSAAAVFAADGRTEPLLAVGDDLAIAAWPDAEIRAFLERAAADPRLASTLVGGDQARLGFAARVPEGDPRFLVYAEDPLPDNRTSVPQADSAFAGLDYAIYLGPDEDPEALLVANTTALPIDGRRAQERIAFGDSMLLLVMTPTTVLGGGVFAALPWIVLAVGGLFVLVSAALTERQLRLSDDNARLFAEQRTVATTLQQSLLPRRFPTPPGVDIAARYQPGVHGMDIGGDWFDVVEGPDGRLVVVIGDVSGRGVHAASVMASVRYAGRALAAQGDAPEVILAKLNAADDPDRGGHFATVLCGAVDLAAGTATFASAGHPGPIVVDGDEAGLVRVVAGPPVGVLPGSVYRVVTVRLPASGALLLFTDGLFERRDEPLDVGLERLRAAAQRASMASTLDAMLDAVVDAAAVSGNDDAAVLALRWVATSAVPPAPATPTPAGAGGEPS